MFLRIFWTSLTQLILIEVTKVRMNPTWTSTTPNYHPKAMELPFKLLTNCYSHANPHLMKKDVWCPITQSTSRFIVSHHSPKRRGRKKKLYLVKQKINSLIDSQEKKFFYSRIDGTSKMSENDTGIKLIQRLIPDAKWG